MKLVEGITENNKKVYVQIVPHYLKEKEECCILQELTAKVRDGSFLKDAFTSRTETNKGVYYNKYIVGRECVMRFYTSDEAYYIEMFEEAMSDSQ